VVELIDRAVEADLVERRGDEADHRVVRLALTELGEKRIEELSRLHLEELRRLPRWPEGDD
jgi:DNA-binding MarR family transcriptional regulator